jgi:hypothetical protein
VGTKVSLFAMNIEAENKALCKRTSCSAREQSTVTHRCLEKEEQEEEVMVIL